MSDDLKEDAFIDSTQSVREGDVFELVYNGPDVATGTMSARQLIEVVSGLQKAFSTVSHDRDYGDRLELRIRDIEHSSVHLVFEAVAYAKANPAAATALIAAAGVGLNALTNVVTGGYRVITDIASAIEAKKKARGTRIGMMKASFTDTDVALTTPDGVITLTKEQYELLLSQRIDRPLAQIMSPLEANKIESFQLNRQNVQLANVAAPERDFFDYAEVSEERSREGTEIVGTLNSLTKTSLRGTFYTADGVHVPYKYTGGDIQQLFRGFSAREPLRVHGKIKFGGDGYPTFIEVQDIEFIQRSLII